MKGESASIHHDQIHYTLLSDLAFKEWSHIQGYVLTVLHRPPNTPPGSEAAWVVLGETSALFASEKGLLSCLFKTK